MITHDEFKKAIETIRKYELQIEKHYNKVKKQAATIPKYVNINKEMYIVDIDMPVRLIRILQAIFIKNGFVYDMEHNRGYKLKEVEKISESEFLSFRQAGKQMLKELREICYYAGVKLRK